MSLKAQVQQYNSAFKAGQEAFKQGISKVPCRCPKLRQIFKAKRVKVGEGIPYFIAWRTGWDKAHLESFRLKK